MDLRKKTLGHAMSPHVRKSGEFLLVKSGIYTGLWNPEPA